MYAFCSWLKTVRYSTHWYVVSPVCLKTAAPYLIFVTCTTCGAGVKNSSLVSIFCKLVCFGKHIWNFVFLVSKDLDLVCFWCQLKMVLVSTKWQISGMHLIWRQVIQSRDSWSDMMTGDQLRRTTICSGPTVESTLLSCLCHCAVECLTMHLRFSYFTLAMQRNAPISMRMQ